MIVVSDTGPLNYLLLIDEIDLLPRLYGSVIVPARVRQELDHPNAPEVVRRWAALPPSWASVRTPRTLLGLALDAGEREALSLAVELQADLVLMDEQRGRRIAEAQGLVVTGTLGILKVSAQRGLVDLADVLARLRRTSFQASDQLLADIQASVRE